MFLHSRLRPCLGVTGRCRRNRRRRPPQSAIDQPDSERQPDAGQDACGGRRIERATLAVNINIFGQAAEAEPGWQGYGRPTVALSALRRRPGSPPARARSQVQPRLHAFSGPRGDNRRLRAFDAGAPDRSHQLPMPARQGPRLRPGRAAEALDLTNWRLLVDAQRTCPFPATHPPPGHPQPAALPAGGLERGRRPPHVGQRRQSPHRQRRLSRRRSEGGLEHELR